MQTATRRTRVLVLVVTALVAAGGESLVLPVAHLFADHHHEIVLSADSGDWQWAQVADHHNEAEALSVEHRDHHHEIRATEAALRLGNTAGFSSASILIESIDGDSRAPASPCHGSFDSAPDIGKPDLALLATMRV